VLLSTHVYLYFCISVSSVCFYWFNVASCVLNKYIKLQYIHHDFLCGVTYRKYIVNCWSVCLYHDIHNAGNLLWTGFSRTRGFIVGGGLSIPRWRGERRTIIYPGLVHYGSVRWIYTPCFYDLKAKWHSTAAARRGVRSRGRGRREGEKGKCRGEAGWSRSLMNDGEKAATENCGRKSTNGCVRNEWLQSNSSRYSVTNCSMLTADNVLNTARLRVVYLPSSSTRLRCIRLIELNNFIHRLIHRQVAQKYTKIMNMCIITV